MKLSVFDQLEVPIVQAPLAGGASTPKLAAAVANAGGLGFIAAGYKSPRALAADIASTRALTERPFGVNVFAPTGQPAATRELERYAERLSEEAARAGVPLGAPRFDDDNFEAKLELLCDDPVTVVSFTFGCPPSATIDRVRAAGSSVWVTVTDPSEARQATDAGADALIVQGLEAGGHRASFVDREDGEQFGLLALLQLVRAHVDVPLVASGGIASGRAVAAVMAAGAVAAQVGTAFMRSAEAATSRAHREALAAPAPTGLTRAFSGRLARGIVNRLQADHSGQAPIAYPEIHHITSPLRARGREIGDPDLINLWAGQAHELAPELPAAEIVARMMAEAREAIGEAERRLRRG